jgi:hypothetical protein
VLTSISLLPQAIVKAELFKDIKDANSVTSPSFYVLAAIGYLGNNTTL